MGPTHFRCEADGEEFLTSEYDRHCRARHDGAYVAITPFSVPLPELVCSKCGITESETEYGRLIDVRASTAEGEEGSSDVTQYLCDEDFIPVQEGLLALGFSHHHHGSTDFLADSNCIGDTEYGSCPNPSGYGRYFVGNTWLNEDED